MGTSNRAFWGGLAAVGLALTSGFATSLILTGATRISPTGNVFLLVIFCNLLMTLPLIGVVAWQIWALWKSRREQAAGSRLHLRIVGLFSVIAIAPAIILAVFASISLSRALDGVFSKRVKTIVENSRDVARTYVEEHGTTIRSDIVAMARDIDATASLVTSKPDQFKALFATQAGLRDLVRSYLLDGEGRILMATDKGLDPPFAGPPPAALAEAKAGQAVVIGPGRLNQVGAVQKLDNFVDTYLYVLRPVDAKVLRHLARTEEGVKRYGELEQLRRGIQIASGIIYVVIALTLLLASIWLGLWFANRLVAPVRRLIAAAQEIAKGNFNVTVPVRGSESDLKQLLTTFNRMTSEIKSQRDDLITANSEVTERRRFIEAVLSGVTAGVLGLDGRGTITLTNPSAERLLNKTHDQLVGHALHTVVPEFAALLEDTSDTHRIARAQQQITLPLGDDERSFAVRVTREQAGDESQGSVLTFDDITELVTAQRTSAWADIARRIAHEIKNPLTPIQLSAERLKRKYGAAITEDREIFDKCVDTIIRRVGDIGQMVDEFSSFARMPKPQMEREDIGQVVREAVVLYELGSSDIDVSVVVPKTPIIMLCDRRLVTQALTNLIKNAGEAIQTLRDTKDVPADYRGRIETRVWLEGQTVILEVIDNGVGLPKQNRGRLVEPYVTTRAKGTGLGLAIVQKITEQHGGVLALEDAPAVNGLPARGALVRLSLPLLLRARDSGTSDDRASQHAQLGSLPRTQTALALDGADKGRSGDPRVGVVAISRTQAGE